jgi:hypothetical protein
MKNTSRHLTATWRYALSVALLFAAASWASVSAQTPITVLVEGNTCGEVAPSEDAFLFSSSSADFDGDGDTGTAEDTDGDTVYGTIQAALEAIDHNGKVVIVTSGCFYENVYIGQQFGTIAPIGAVTPGNVTLEAAPGVGAVIDAFAPATDPASAGNNTRSQGTGVNVNYTTNGASRVVTIRNVQIRNFAIGIAVDNTARANVDRVRIENNVFYGIRYSNSTRGTVSYSHVSATGFRFSNAPAPPPPPAQAAFIGSGIFANQTSQVHIVDTVSTQNANYGVAANTATGVPVVVVNRVNAALNNTAATFGPVTQCANVALCP